jgi:succinate-semialdehyde dehydrogenase/glutarate-semialdehyde dehydrogenase
MLINGEWQTDTPTFPVFNPATGEEIGQVANGTEQDAARAIDAASAALPAWMSETAYARSSGVVSRLPADARAATRAG